jgi:single-strand DNA-binding protein
MNAKIIIAGRLGRDPEIRFTKTGKAVCDLNVAVNEKVKRGNGFVDSVTWHRVVLWQGLAEDAQSLRKGSAIRVEGFQKSRTFEGRDGVTREVVEIVADKFEALDSPPQSASAPGARSSTTGVSDQPDRQNGALRNSKSVPKPYSQPAGIRNRPTNGGVPPAQIPDGWENV